MKTSNMEVPPRSALKRTGRIVSKLSSKYLEVGKFALYVLGKLWFRGRFRLEYECWELGSGLRCVFTLCVMQLGPEDLVIS